MKEEVHYWYIVCRRLFFSCIIELSTDSTEVYCAAILTEACHESNLGIKGVNFVLRLLTHHV